MPGIDDAHDSRVGWNLGWKKGKARFFAADEEHFLSDTRTNRISGNNRAADRFAGRRHGLNQQKRHAFERCVFHAHNNSPYDTSQLHGFYLIRAGPHPRALPSASAKLRRDSPKPAMLTSGRRRSLTLRILKRSTMCLLNISH